MKKILYTIGLPISILGMIACSGNTGNVKDAEANGGKDITEKSAENMNTEKDTYTDTEGNVYSDDSIYDKGSSTISNYKKDITFNGVIAISPRCHSTITPTMGGAIDKIYIFPGDFVKKGQVIATLRNPEFIKLQQEFLTASAQVEFLEKEYMRQEKLAVHEAASEKKLQQSKAEFLSEKSNLDAARAQLELLEVNTDILKEKGLKTYLEVKAPISGYITGMQANQGEYFNAGQPICDIIDKSETLLQLTAYEKDLAYISVGNNVTFTVNGIDSRNFNAEIIAIDQMVNSENRSINVYAKVKSTDKLFRQGMYVSARVDGNM